MLLTQPIALGVVDPENHAVRHVGSAWGTSNANPKHPQRDGAWPVVDTVNCTSAWELPGPGPLPALDLVRQVDRRAECRWLLW